MINGEEDYHSQWQHGTLVQDAWFFQLTWLRGPYDDNRVLLVRKPAGNPWGVAVNEQGRIIHIVEGGHFDNARKFRIDEGQPKPGDIIVSVNTIPGHTVLAATRHVTFTARIVWWSQADYAVPKAPPSGLVVQTKLGCILELPTQAEGSGEKEEHAEQDNKEHQRSSGSFCPEAWHDLPMQLM
jgi:hypothetical protein